MLFIARQARGLSQEEATKRTEILSQPTYSRIEAGLRTPTGEEIDAIAKGLDVRRNFLFHPFLRRPMPAIFHRKRQKLTARDWEQIFARAELRRICVALMVDRVRITPKLLPPPQVDPSINGAAGAAVAIRQAWMIPRGPIADLTRIVEASGIIVISFDFGTDLLDGFSERTQDSLPPLIFVNSRQPRDRLRFTLAHELGHIVMHRVPYPDMEDEANAFASELLMPSEDIFNDFFSFSPDHFMLLKGKWKTSIASLIRKARDLDKISQHEYVGYNIDLGKMGWKKNEPLPLPDDIEVPRTLKSLISAHTDKLGYTSEEMSKLFGLPQPEVEEEFGLVRPREKLRLVVSD
jgi:Zn-dependent peptidase ImmA (M78 family)/transcriptional regulator with XRE-family HTH domain